jgi:hypothetical protein
MKFRAVLWLCLSIACQTHAAEPAEEGVDSLGRVFMSAEERVLLDQLRRNQAGDSGGEPLNPATNEAADFKATASGFIIRSEGEAYLWVDGDFEVVRPDKASVSAADNLIDIVRHSQPVADGVAKPTPSDSEGTDDEPL